MKDAIAGLITSFIIVVSVPAQTIRVAPATEVAREIEPTRFSEPHLAIDPSNPNHLLAAVWTASTSQDENQPRRCVSFESQNGGVTWSRHDFATLNCYDAQVAILSNGEAVFVTLGTLPGVRPDRGDWLLLF